MKVILVNGSPHEKGCTYTALAEVASALEQEGIETDIFWIGTKAITGCIACHGCAKTGRCVFHDKVNEFLELAPVYDGYIFGSPVHWAAAGGAITSFMDRVFYSAGSLMANKPAATIVVCRRGGASATFDQINKYYTINNMLIVGSNYWNSVHTATPEAIAKDAEGLQTMRTLGVNMAWILKCIEAGKNSGISAPKREDKIATFFAQ